MKKIYQLIALDMDGTALNDHKQIDERTQSAIHQALSLGKEVVFCTGRALCEMDEYLGDFPDMRYLCLESGALIYDIGRQSPLHMESISLDTIQKIRNAVSERETLPQIISKGRSLINQSQAHMLDHFQMGVYQKLYDRSVTPVADVFEFAEKECCNIEKFNLYHTSPEEREQSWKALQKLNLPLTIVPSERTSLECTALGISKATGLLKLCELLGISMEQVIMVGDADNDRAALEAAGLAVAMGNARPEITAICHAQVADNNHSGCAEAIERFLL